ncbi:hypothetical protein NL676_018617 [Syzygium grande]|nr:hypothetical protein NL676_018617 [Syzygium grande]
MQARARRSRLGLQAQPHSRTLSTWAPSRAFYFVSSPTNFVTLLFCCLSFVSFPPANLRLFLLSSRYLASAAALATTLVLFCPNRVLTSSPAPPQSLPAVASALSAAAELHHLASLLTLCRSFTSDATISISASSRRSRWFTATSSSSSPVQHPPPVAHQETEPRANLVSTKSQRMSRRRGTSPVNPSNASTNGGSVLVAVEDG